MTASATSPTASAPIMIELDAETWKSQLDIAEQWFDTVLMIQTAFRQLAEDTAAKLHEPHLKAYIGEVAETAQRHEQQLAELYVTIGREPSGGRSVAGTLMAKGREVVADVLGVISGAPSPWRDLHQLFLASLNAISAVATAEQFGLALGIREVVEITFPMTNEKFVQHRMIQELTLEMVPIAFLYNMPV